MNRFPTLPSRTLPFNSSCSCVFNSRSITIDLLSSVHHHLKTLFLVIQRRESWRLCSKCLHGARRQLDNGSNNASGASREVCTACFGQFYLCSGRKSCHSDAQGPSLEHSCFVSPESFCLEAEDDSSGLTFYTSEWGNDCFFFFFS